MISNTNNIYYISNDWGWYVDIENNSYINNPNINIYGKKKVNKLPSIKEEYNYHNQKSKKDVETLDDVFDCKGNEKNNFNQEYLMYKIGTPLITALLTYTILFLFKRLN